MSLQTIAVTGGNGQIGASVLEHLSEQGYRTFNLSLGEREESTSDTYLAVDLLDAGQVYSALARSDADAVVHLGTIPGPMHRPGHIVYESNILSSYHVLEAATNLDFETVCLPSSINVLGAAFQEAPIEVSYLPVDEEHPVTPRDPYAISKHTLELVSDSFARRMDGPRIASLRFPWVANDQDLRENVLNDPTTVDCDADLDSDRQNLFAYVHVRDVATAVRRTLETDFDGHETFWIAAADTTIDVPSQQLAEEFYPTAANVDLTGTESLINTEKAGRILGWEPTNSWRNL